MDYKINEWVSFLRRYGPIPQNDNMYDESIRRLTKKLKIQPLSFEVPLRSQLIENFTSASPVSVILTGTAGDGKTHLCSQVWEAVGGEPAEWLSDSKVRRTKLKGGRRLIVVKDLSEVSIGRERKFLADLCESASAKDPKDVFLIAANDGQLIAALKELGSGKKERKVADAIERMLVDGTDSRKDLSLRLHNLSRTDVPELFSKMLDALLSHPGWKGCAGCPGTGDDSSVRCPIWHNYQTLVREQLLRRRLSDLLTLCELNDLHLAIRQILIVLTNAILGHPDVDDRLMSCESVDQVVSSGAAAKASPYRNVFGMNLTRRRREDLAAFDALSRFGIGNETNNAVDNILIYGSDDPQLAPYFDELVRPDAAYGFHRDFATAQKAYLESDVGGGAPPLLAELPSQRQRLFFTLPDSRATLLGLWELSLFRYGGEYLSEVYRPLLDRKPVKRAIVYRLVRGLNRIFTGFLVKDDRTLYVASSNSHSQSRISRLLTDTISVDPKKGEQINLEYDPAMKRVFLKVYLSPDIVVPPLPLHPVRYEFLSRVAEGALPSSFSRECYEDFLAFKSHVHKAIEVRRKKEGSVPSSDGTVTLTLFDVGADGFPRPRPLEVQA